MDEKAICALGRKQLQALAKQHGIKANMKNAEIVSELLPLLSHAQPARTCPGTSSKRVAVGLTQAQRAAVAGVVKV